MRSFYDKKNANFIVLKGIACAEVELFTSL